MVLLKFVLILASIGLTISENLTNATLAEEAFSPENLTRAKIESFIQVLMKNTLYGTWEILDNNTIKYFDNKQGLVQINLKRYNVSSYVTLNDFLRFTITLYDGESRNKWIEMKNYGLAYYNLTYDFEENIFGFVFNTTQINLGELFESREVLMNTGKLPLTADSINGMSFSFENKSLITNLPNYTEEFVGINGFIHSNDGIKIHFNVNSTFEINKV
jgi:hypothetical protein